MKKKFLFISNEIKNSPVGGRRNLSSLNENILRTVFRNNFFSIKLKKKKIKSLSDILLALTGSIDGISGKKINHIKEFIKKNQIEYVFIDGSNLGKIARKIEDPKIRIITFCHNVEANFFLKKFLTFLSFRNFYIFICNFLAELQSIYFSDYLIFLNKRDKSMMFKYYLKKNFFIIPICLKDKFKKYKNSFNHNNFIMFVGSNFFGNISGLEWYIEHVVSKINIKTLIVGKNLVNYKHKNNPKVVYKGYVKNLNYYYKKALFVVAPIFKGSGMKTKVAESLMHGKKIVGLKEAFIGYDKFEKKIGVKCSNSKELIIAINHLLKKKHLYFEPGLRNLYLKNFSDDALKNYYKEVFKKI